MFHLPVQQEEAACNLLLLRQGRRSVADYASNFRIMAARTDWDESTLRGTFHNSLSETIKDQLALQEEPRSLDDLISLAIRIDNRIWGRQQPNKNPVYFLPSRNEVCK